MGCDIHPVIQVQYFDGGNFWDNRIVPSRERSYGFFGTLAGVRRDDVPMIAAPRGWPTGLDPADLDGWCCMDGDGHTASWFTLAEAKEFVKRLANTDGTEPWLIAMWDSWIADMEYAKKYARDEVSDDRVRVVFNFDN